ncbi:MAG: phenylalanine--tRNA ligase subunit beta [Candidatus Woesearchaeota archaeon]
MPTITLNKKVFERLVGRKMPAGELKETISYIGTDLEGIEGNEIHVEVFPNRPDMLSEQGFARAISSFTGIKKGLRGYKAKKSGEKVIIDRSVSKVRPYTACAIVKNLDFDDEKIKELVEIQEKLHMTYGRKRKKAAIGIYPYEKIKPPIRFMASPPKEIRFRPLESEKEMDAAQVLRDTSAGREYGGLLEGLDKYPFFIDSKGNILSMPPIINSHTTGKISEDTKEVFIECSGFDFNVLSVCLNIIVTALADMGGEIYSMELEYCDTKRRTPDLEPRRIKVNPRYINSLLGLNLKEKDIKDCLERMGYGYSKGTALVPPYRADVLHQVDIVEDIGIAYGYKNFNEEIPKVATTAREDPFNIFKGRIADLLTGLGMIETSTYNLIDKKTQTKDCGLDVEVVEIIDPVSRDYNSLRFWMIPSLLNVLKNNKHNEFPQRIFEIGSVFKRSDKEESGVSEAARLGVLLCGSKADFTDIMQVADYIMRMLGAEYEVMETQFPPFIEGRAGRIAVNGKKVAYIGETHPAVLERFDIETPVAALELNLTDLFKVLESA